MTEKEISEMMAEKENVGLKVAAVGAVVSELSATAAAGGGDMLCGVCSEERTSIMAAESSSTTFNSGFTATQNNNNNNNNNNNINLKNTDSIAGKKDCELENDLFVNTLKDELLVSEGEYSLSSSSSSELSNDKIGSSSTPPVVKKYATKAFIGTVELTSENMKSFAIDVVRKEVYEQGLNKLFLDSDIDAFIAHSVEESMLGLRKDKVGNKGERVNLEDRRNEGMKSLPLKNMKLDDGSGITVGEVDEKGIAELETEDSMLHDREGSLQSTLRHRSAVSSVNDTYNHNITSNEIVGANTDSQQVLSYSIGENHGNQLENVISYQPDLLDKFLTFILYLVGTAICFVVFRRFCCLWLFYSKNNLFLGYRNL